MPRKFETEIVPTNTLAVGDVVLLHGGIFIVREVKAWTHNWSEDGGEVHSNYCEFICDAFDGYRCAIPEHWRVSDRGYWSEQGNGRARTVRLVNPPTEFLSRV